MSLFSVAPLYMHLFQFFYQQLLPNADGLMIKIINSIGRKLNKTPFIEPRLRAKFHGNPDVFLFLCTPFIPTCDDALELTIFTFLLLIITPLFASWSVQILTNSTNAFYYLASCLDKMNLLAIFLIYYNARCDTLLLHGDISSNPGPPLLSYMHWNVNSLSADEFARIPLLQAHAAIHGYHLIAITESGLTNKTSDEKIKIPGYTPVRCDLVDGISHGGVVVYYKNDLAAVNRPDLALPTNTIVLSLTIENKKVFFVTSYRKYGQTDQQYKLYMEQLDDTLEKITSEDPHERILTGDFNAHNKEWYDGDKTDNFGRDMQETLEQHSLHQLVDQPTYITNNGKSLVDLVCVGQPNLMVCNEVIPSIYDKCHHQINHVKLNFKCFPPPPYKRFVWHFGRANKDLLQRANRMYDWVGELTKRNDDPEAQVEHFDEVINNISKNFIPHEEKTFHPGDPPWLTKNCKNFYKKYYRSYKRFARRGFPPAEKARVDTLKKEYTTMITAAKDSYLRRLGLEVSDPRTGQKKYWTALKKLINKSVSTVIPPILYNNVFVTDAHEKCVIFNNYFKNQCTLLNTASVIPAFECKTPHSISTSMSAQTE